jgi:hypothetical protein
LKTDVSFRSWSCRCSLFDLSELDLLEFE